MQVVENAGPVRIWQRNYMASLLAGDWPDDDASARWCAKLPALLSRQHVSGEGGEGLGANDLTPRDKPVTPAWPSSPNMSVGHCASCNPPGQSWICRRMGWRRWGAIRETGKRLRQRGHDVVGVNADQPVPRLTWYTSSAAGSKGRFINKWPAARRGSPCCGLIWFVGSAMWGSRRHWRSGDGKQEAAAEHL